MKVYSCDGAAFDDASNGCIYYRTKAEAMTAARQSTVPVPDAINWHGHARVSVHEIRKVDATRIVALLNHECWSEHSQVIAEFTDGRRTV